MVILYFNSIFYPRDAMLARY